MTQELMTTTELARTLGRSETFTRALLAASGVEAAVSFKFGNKTAKMYDKMMLPTFKHLAAERTVATREARVAHGKRLGGATKKSRIEERLDRIEALLSTLVEAKSNGAYGSYQDIREAGSAYVLPPVFTTAP